MKFHISGYMLLKLHDLRTLSPEDALAITCYESRITTVNSKALPIGSCFHFERASLFFHPYEIKRSTNFPLEEVHVYKTSKQP